MVVPTKNNILLHDGIIKLVDFEYALPENSDLKMEKDFIRHIRDIGIQCL